MSDKKDIILHRTRRPARAQAAAPAADKVFRYIALKAQAPSEASDLLFSFLLRVKMHRAARVAKAAPTSPATYYTEIGNTVKRQTTIPSFVDPIAE